METRGRMEAKNNQSSISGGNFLLKTRLRRKKENTPKSFVIHTKDRLKPKKEGRGERIRINLRKIHHLKG